MGASLKKIIAAVVLALVSASAPWAYGGTDGAGFGSVARMQESLAKLPVGERVAFWANSFVGTPYDTDPLGLYVRTEKVVCDNEVDCMYLVFRSAELATSKTPDEAEERALELRFRTRGKVEGGRVTNYDERFDYAEDMVFSGKWGRDVTGELGKTENVPGSRGHETITYLPKAAALAGLAGLKSGDVIFFVKDPARRVVGEVVGHLGIVKVEDGATALIHASGRKDIPERKGSGAVRKVSLADYIREMKFIGVIATRLEEAPRP